VLVADRGSLPPNQHPTVLIGKDTRISGYMLEAALEAGLTAAGVNVLMTGPMPTPAVAYLTRALRLQAGVVISASHNPFEDNGIKFFSASGQKLPDSVEKAIEARLDFPLNTVEARQLGRARRIEDAAARYIEFCKSTFPNHLDLRGMRIGSTVRTGRPIICAASAAQRARVSPSATSERYNITKSAVPRHFGAGGRGACARRRSWHCARRRWRPPEMATRKGGYTMATSGLRHRAPSYQTGFMKGGVVGTLMTISDRTCVGPQPDSVRARQGG